MKKLFADLMNPARPYGTPNEKVNHQETMTEFYERQQAEMQQKYKDKLDEKIKAESFKMDNATSSVYERHLQTFIGLGIMALVSWVAVEFNEVAVMTARMDERTLASNEITQQLKTTMDLYHETMVTKAEMVNTAIAYKDQASIVHDLMEEKIRAIEQRMTAIEDKVYNK